jgi:hypothetical protein
MFRRSVVERASGLVRIAPFNRQIVEKSIQRLADREINQVESAHGLTQKRNPAGSVLHGFQRPHRAGAGQCRTHNGMKGGRQRIRGGAPEILRHRILWPGQDTARIVETHV